MALFQLEEVGAASNFGGSWNRFSFRFNWRKLGPLPWFQVEEVGAGSVLVVTVFFPFQLEEVGANWRNIKPLLALFRLEEVGPLLASFQLEEGRATRGFVSIGGS